MMDRDGAAGTSPAQGLPHQPVDDRALGTPPHLRHDGGHDAAGIGRRGDAKFGDDLPDDTPQLLFRQGRGGGGGGCGGGPPIPGVSLRDGPPPPPRSKASMASRRRLTSPRRMSWISSSVSDRCFSISAFLIAARVSRIVETCTASPARKAWRRSASSCSPRPTGGKAPGLSDAALPARQFPPALGAGLLVVLVPLGLAEDARPLHLTLEPTQRAVQTLILAHANLCHATHHPSRLRPTATTFSRTPSAPRARLRRACHSIRPRTNRPSGRKRRRESGR